MSVDLPLSNLSQENRKYILTSLAIQNKQFYDGNRYRQKFKNKDDSYPFYKINPDNTITIPMAFAADMFGCVFNPTPRVARSFTFTGTLRERQVPIVQQAWQQLTTSGRVLLGLYPAFGKTISSLFLLSKLNTIGLLLIDAGIHITSWDNSLKLISDGTTWILGQPKPVKPYNLIICMQERITKLTSEELAGVGCLILDEAHSLCTPTAARAILMLKPTFIIACTATPDKNSKTEKVLEYMVAPKSKWIMVHDPKPYNVYIVKTGIEIEIPKNKNDVANWALYCEGIASHPLHNSIIVTVTRMFLHRKPIVMAYRIFHAEILYNFLLQNGISVARMFGKDKSYKDANVLVGGLDKIGEGFDAKMFCEDYWGVPWDTLIVCCTFRDRGVLTQALGRVMRSDDPLIIMICNDDSIAKSHSKVHVGYFRLRNGILHDMKLKWDGQKCIDCKIDTFIEEPDIPASSIDTMKAGMEQLEALGL